MAEFKYLFSPIELGPIKVRNRLAITAHGVSFPGKRMVRYYEERAKGGVGLFCVFAGYFLNDYPIGPGRFDPATYGPPDSIPPHPLSSQGIKFLDDLVTPMLRAQTEAIHRHGAACVGQLFHGGSCVGKLNFQPLPAPSELPDRWLCEVPHELEIRDIEGLIEASIHAARRIKEAGMDGAEIHAAHGHLVGLFMSPLTNKRSDKYGGSVENRLRFAMEMIDAIKGRLGNDFPIGVRLPADEFAEGGLTVQDMQEIAQRLAKKVTYINISGASRTGLKGKSGVSFGYVAPWLVPLGPFVPMAAAIKEVVDIPVIVGCRINDPVFAEKIIADGHADMVGMVRAFYADPEFGNKAREGRLDDIRKCIGCNEGCRRILVRRGGPMPLGCTVNASVGNEEAMEPKPAQVRKNVLVVGGGPAGMEAARVLALRGHKVALYEKEAELGGHFNTITRAPIRQDWADLPRYLETQVRKLGVDVKLGVEVTPELVANLKPDAVVVATGSVSYIPDVPGVNGPNVATAPQALQGEKKVGQRVLVVAGQDDHMNPLCVADFLADQGKKVEVLAETLNIGENIEPITIGMLTRRLLQKGATLTPMTTVKSIKERTVVVFNNFTGQERTIEGVDTVVIAAGNRANNQLHRSLQGKVKELYAVGDCLAPRLPINAVREGHLVGLQI